MATFPAPAVREDPHPLMLQWVSAHYAQTHARAHYQRQDARASGISSACKAVDDGKSESFLESVLLNTQSKKQISGSCVIT